MHTVKNYFSKSLYLQGLRKIRTAGIAMAIVIIVINALVPTICMIESQMGYGFPGMTRSVTEVSAGMATPASLGVILFAPILTYVMFSYLNERRASDFYHALPQKRICVYTSFIAAILTWIVGTLVASMLLNSFLWLIARWYDASVLVMLMSTLAYVITALVMVGFMVLAMTVTGTTVSNLLVFILFTLFVRAFGLFFLHGLEDVAPMFNVENSLLRVFDIQFFMPLRLFVEIFDGESAAYFDAPMLIYWAIVGILLLIGAGVCYHYRKSESATKSAPSRVLQHIYRIAVTFPFMMLTMFMILIDGGLESYHLIFLVIAALVWIIYEILTTKKIKNVVRSLPLFFVPVLLSLCYVAGIYAARTVIYNTTPDREDIVSVQVSGTHARYIGSWGNTVMLTHTVEDPDVLDLIPLAIDETKETLYLTHTEAREKGYVHMETLTLTLKSGRKVTYDLKSSILFGDVLATCDDLSHLIYSIPDDRYLEKGNMHVDDISFREYQEAIWAAFRTDFAALSDAEKREYFRWNDDADSKAYIYVYGTYRDRNFHQYYYLNAKYTPNAIALYYDYLNRETSPIKTLGKIKETIGDLMENVDAIHTVSMEIIGDRYNAAIYTEDIRVIHEFLETMKIDLHLTDYTRADKIYEVVFCIDPDYSEEYYYYETDSNGKLIEESKKPMAMYYMHERCYLTLSEADLDAYYAIEKKYSKNEMSHETTAIVVQ
jgi:hypothetical protein